MTETDPARLAGGRLLALAGIILAALGLRTAVAVVSPIADQIAVDIPFGSIGLGLLGMLPPVAFAIFALLTPAIVHRLGLERTMVFAIIASIAGHLLRAVAPEFGTLVAGSIIVLIGTGVGNVLMPPLVRRYFPTRIGLLTTVVTTLMSVSTAVPSLLAAPIASAAGWRLALGVWASIGVTALVPWIALAVRQHRSGDDESLGEAEPTLLTSLRKSPTAWSLAAVMATSSFGAYAAFAWLPQILAERTTLDPVAAGALLSLYGLAGFPASLVVPILAARLRNVGVLIYTGVGFFVAGYLGLLLAPQTATWLWVLLAGLGPMLFPVALALIGLRSRTHSGSVALSGFVQGVGYTIGSLGPLLVGLLHEASGGYTVPLIGMLVLSLPAIIAGFRLRGPRYVEDEIAAADARA
ncbi:MFS transporter [Amnibacterium flavum]|uniref:MFS transporter n=1 Tax=Amnibacterium flavum TaxID=2173173 RepID=A0A2V1HRN7_9MICO|nr:MFS transporter [Amnibacterium flavum]PVZ93630.1 MFS transporter [Amnibacterium flavum]